MKVCLECKVEKEIINFTKDISKKDKLNNYCRDCNKNRKDRWSSENKENIREYDIKYNKERRVIDKERMIEYKKKYQLKLKYLERTMRIFYVNVEG